MNLPKPIYFLLGWVIPGLGHISLKKYWRGAIFFACIASMTGIGVYMGGRIFPLQTFLRLLNSLFSLGLDLEATNPLAVLAFFADMGNGFFYILSRIFSFGTGNIKNVTYEFGTAYIAGAGLLNYLVALDAFDIASGKKK